MGDSGNDFQRLLVAPASERLLNLGPGEMVLEIACGNGVFALRMADLAVRMAVPGRNPRHTPTSPVIREAA
jgi:hypothetical protein